MTPMPVLLSIPHGGTQIPDLLRDRVCLDRVDIHDDIDPFTREIYDLGARVLEVITTDIARTFVDLNRAPDDLPPKNPDGVVKTMTCVGRRIFKAGREPDQTLITALLDRYYHPYHRRLQAAVQRADLRLAVDCHSMLAVGPQIAPDTGRPRPTICLGNRHGQTCSQEMIDRFAACCREAFGLAASEVTLNVPFAGGYITRTYGGRPLPWIQMELNRALYLVPPYFERTTLTIDRRRLQDLRDRFERTLRLFFDESV